MLYLLDKNVRTAKWNGIPLHEAKSAIVKEVLNGDFTLTVRYPITDSGIYQLIKEDMLIKAPVPVLGEQLFRIKKPIETDDSLEITAYHISDDIMTRLIKPVSVASQGCAVALSQLVQNAKTDLGDFSFASDITDNHTFNTEEVETLYSVLMDGKHSIVGTWEGELVRDNLALSIKRNRGANRGVVITTHKNLKSYQRTKDSQGVVTRIHASSTFKLDKSDKEITISVTVDSPLIGNYPYINEKDYENNDLKTEADLRKWAEAKFKHEGIDKVSDAIEIEAYELDGQIAHLGDTVKLKSKKHNVDVDKKAIAYEYNALTEKYLSITFDDKAGVGGSGVSSGLSNAATAIINASTSNQDINIARAIKNANQAFEAAFNEQKTAIEDGIEQAKSAAEVYAAEIRQEIEKKVSDVTEKIESNEQDQATKYADVLSKADSSLSLASEAKRLSEEAKASGAESLEQVNLVKFDVASHSRTLLEQGKSISQVLQTAEGLVSRVGAISDAQKQNLVYDPTNYSKFKKRNSATSNLAKPNNGIYSLLRISESGLTSPGWRGFQVPLHSSRFIKGEKLSYRVSVWVDVLPDDIIEMRILNGSATIASWSITADRIGADQIYTGTVEVQQTTMTTDDYGLHVWLRKNGTVAFGQLSIVRGDTPPENFVDSTSAQQVATETLAQHLQGSYAIQNLTSAGALISGINLGADGHNRIDGRATHITGDTLIDRAVIKSAMVDKLKTANFEAGSVTAPVIAGDAVTAKHLKVDNALISKLTADDALLRNLTARQAFITSVQSVDLSATRITGGILKSINGATTFNLQTGWIDMNSETVGIRNKFPNMPIQYLVFGRGAINGKSGTYTALMSNMRREIGMDWGSAGIQIWNTMDNTTAVNLYGDTVTFAHNADDKKSISINNHNNEINGVMDIQLSSYGNYKLKAILNDIYNNLKLLHNNKTTETGYNYSMIGPK